MYTLVSFHKVTRSMKKRRKSGVNLSNRFQEKLNIMHDFLKANNWRVTISASEELERNLKAINLREVYCTHEGVFV